jgi:AraC-like DNA-binding protein
MVHKLYSLVNKAKDATLYQTKYLIDILIESIMEKKIYEEKKNKIPYYIAAIKEKFDHNYHDNYTLDAFEHEYHISKYRICREFNEHFDISPIQYLTNRRIEVAKEILISSDKRVNEIGRLVGYENTNLFIRLFKEQTGITPLAFRKKSPVLPYCTGLEQNEKIH